MTWVNSYGQELTKQVTVTNEKLGLGVYTTWQTCGRCGGAGGSEAWKFTGYTCYECQGNKGKHVEKKAYTPEAYVKLEARRAQAAEKKAAKAAAAAEAAALAYAAWVRDHAEEVAAINAMAPENGILADFARQLGYQNSLSDKQLAFAANLVTEARQAVAARKTSTHFGEVGKRYKNIQVNYIDQLASGQGHFGYWYIYKLVTAEGQELIYKGSSCQEPYSCKDNDGQTIGVAFTVKEHTEYQGKKQTLVQRLAY